MEVPLILCLFVSLASKLKLNHQLWGNLEDRQDTCSGHFQKDHPID